MRVLLWAELFWPHMGGGPQFSAELALALNERGHEILVVTRQDEPDVPKVDSFHGIPVRRFPFHQVLTAGDIKRLAELRRGVIELKRTFAADLIHTTSFGASMLFQLDTSRAHPAPLLVTLLGEENPNESPRDTVLHRTLQAADWVTAPSRAALEYAHRLVPACAHRSSVVRVGTRHPQVELQPLPVTDPVLLCLGRLDRVKGFDLAVSAMPGLLERHPSVRLKIAGDGPERGALERQVTQLGIQSAVEFLGRVSRSDVPNLLNTASILVMPSRADAFPLVGVQAAFMARPVVAANVGGIPELVLDKETGLLVEAEDSTALAHAIDHLLERPEEAQRMGTAARRRCVKLLDFDRIVDGYDELYRKIVLDRQARHEGAKGSG